MKPYWLIPMLLLGAGCASTATQELSEARTLYGQIKNDPQVLESAPRDVARAGESLARAQGFAAHWGTDADVAHYAYLSRRYAEIAREHDRLTRNRQQLQRLQREQERLQQMLRESRLLGAQQSSEWLDEQLQRLATIETERGLVMTIGDVLFEPGSSELNLSASRTLLQLVQFLQLNPRRLVRIEGYTDSRGEEEENRELSRLRAQSVAQALMDMGVSSERLQVVGYGEAYPVAENASGRGRAANRRVEIVFSDENGQLGAER